MREIKYFGMHKNFPKTYTDKSKQILEKIEVLTNKRQILKGCINRRFKKKLLKIPYLYNQKPETRNQ